MESFDAVWLWMQESKRKARSAWPRLYGVLVYLWRRTARLYRSALIRAFRDSPLDDTVFFFAFSGNYECNPRAICDRLLSERVPCKLVWATRRCAGMTVPRRVMKARHGSLRFFRELSTARIIVDNGVSLVYSGYKKKEGQILVETWHGSIGIKRFGPECNRNLMWLRNAAREGELTDFVVSNSSFEDAVYRETFWQGTPVWLCGHPRNDILFLGEEEKRSVRDAVREHYGIPSGAKVLLYAPTFRDSHDMSAYLRDFTAVTRALSGRFGGEWVVATRLHWRVRRYLDSYSTSCATVSMSDWPDIQELFLAVDCGITDYSSWICEYMLLRKPGFIFAPDAALYTSEDRLLYFPLTELPFPVASSEEELTLRIKEFDSVRFRADCDAFLSANGSVDDGHASERVVREIRSLLTPPPASLRV